MKPVTGRPRNVTGLATTVPAKPVASVPSEVRVAPTEGRPVVVALVPVNDSLAQPFWKVETLTFVMLREPRTSEAATEPATLRIDSTVDSQHSEPVGAGRGEKSPPAAVAKRSSRSKNVKLMNSQEPADVARAVYGVSVAPVRTNWFLTGWVRTQSVADAVAASSTYSFITALCMKTEATARAPAEARTPPTKSER